MSVCKYCGRIEPHHHIVCDRPMTGDVPLVRELLAECPNFPAACDCAESRAAHLLKSQATRIATLSEALELIAEASYLDGACLIARRALSAGQGEAK